MEDDTEFIGNNAVFMHFEAFCKCLYNFRKKRLTDSMYSENMLMTQHNIISGSLLEED